MREILFRGKQVNKDRWAYGLPIKGTAVDESEILIIQSVFQCDEYFCRGCDFEPIIPETVGQYTGLTDKNGKKIFEWDIVKCADTTYDYSFIAVVMFGNPNGEYNWGFQLKRIRGAGANTDILLWADMEETGACIEVIGNIHDNPELLKGENNA